MRRLRTQAHVAAHRLAVRSQRGARWLLHHYDYAHSPEQLWFLCQQLDEVTNVPGAVVEVGCAAGATTVYLHRHLSARGVRRQLHCVDTFAGFTPDDIATERKRGKEHPYDDFVFNSPDTFAATMRLNGIAADVQIWPADANTFDYAQLGPVAFALVDVDLYRPMLAALRGIFAVLAPGGVVVADDCLADNKWDGALAAYEQVCQELSVPPTIRAGKLGVLRKPLAAGEPTG